jgi:serine/threonine-protein kinase
VRGVLGRGGFGTVYLADLLGQSGFTRAVALKVLNAEVEKVPTIAERLRDEARLLGMLRHRSIVVVDGLVRLDGRWTIVMEYVEGAPLSSLLDRGAVPLGPALEIAGEVAAALHVAFTTQGPNGQMLRLLHRDIKPPNVILTPVGETKVLDFGVARAEFEGREAETRDMLLGSVGYMAPERYELEDGAPADVYSLGVVLWEMATGLELGRTSPKPAKHEARRDEAIRTLASVSGVSNSAVDLIAEMLAFDPAQRPVARDVERRCRDLRLATRGPWLRDWAEAAVPPLLRDPEQLDAHDFSRDVLSEVHSTAGPLPAPDPAPPPIPRRPLPTFSPDDLFDAPDAPLDEAEDAPTSPPVPAPPPVTAAPSPPPAPAPAPAPPPPPDLPPPLTRSMMAEIAPPPGPVAAAPVKAPSDLPPPLTRSMMAEIAPPSPAPPPPPAPSSPPPKAPPSSSSPPRPASPAAEPPPPVTWSEEVGRLAPDRPARDPSELTTRRTRRTRRRRRTSGVVIFLQAFGASTLLASVGAAIVVVFFFVCCCAGIASG